MLYSDNFGFDTIESNPLVNMVNLTNILNDHITIVPFKGENEDLIDWLIDFELASKALGLNANEMFKIIPFYLRGSARKWYNVTFNPHSFQEIPRTYDELRTRMIYDLCPSDYQIHLFQQSHYSKQEPNQLTTNFVYQIQELCMRMNNKMSEKLMVIFIIERLLPQAKFIVTLQNPQTLIELINAAKLVDKTINSRLLQENEIENSNLNQYQFKIKQINEKLNNSVSSIFPIQNENCIHKEIKLNNKKVQSMFDTGSGLTLISKRIADQLNLNLQPYLDPSPLAINNSPVKILGQAKVRIKICDDESAVAITTIVQVTDLFPYQFDVLIGQDLMHKANIIINCASKTIHINNSNLINFMSLPSAKHSKEIEETEISENLDQIKFNQYKSNELNEHEDNDDPLLELVDSVEISILDEIPNLIDKIINADHPNLHMQSDPIKCSSSYQYASPYLKFYSQLDNYQPYHHKKDEIINLNSHEPKDNVFNWLVQRSADEINKE